MDAGFLDRALRTELRTPSDCHELPVVANQRVLCERGRWYHRLRVIAGATNPAMISSTLVADVNGAPNNPISPMTMSHMGTIHLAA